MTYIGQHKYTNELDPMGGYRGSGNNIRKAVKEYGVENFDVEILYKRILTASAADALEIYAIAKYKPEYNMTKGGHGGDTFTCHNDDWKENRRKQMSDWWKANNPNYDPVAQAHLRETLAKRKENGWVSPSRGKPHSEEHNKHVSEGLQRYYQTHEHSPLFGISFTPSHRDKISEARKGYKWFNNGVKSVQAKECPEGFVPGLCEADKAKRRGHTPWNKKVVESKDNKKDGE